MTTTSDDSLEITVRELGYADVRQFARLQAMNLLNRRVREQETIVQTYQQKYQTDWDTFSVRTESASPGIIDREDDEMAWEAALTYLTHLRQRFAAASGNSMKQALTIFADLITDYDVLIDIDEGGFYHFYVRVRLTNGTILYAREYTNLKQALKYAYQWQQADATLIIRWDNSPHHANIATYPYHQHVGTEENVQPSTAMTLNMVLSFIQAQLPVF